MTGSRSPQDREVQSKCSRGGPAGGCEGWVLSTWRKALNPSSPSRGQEAAFPGAPFSHFGGKNKHYLTINQILHLYFGPQTRRLVLLIIGV